jgi:hypothetical protein
MISRMPTIAIAAALLSLAFYSPVRADERQEAVEAYERGVEHFEAERFNEAADAFRRADRLKPSWKLLYNIGQSEAAGRRFGLALEAFEQYLVEGGDDVPGDRREEVLAEIQRLRVLVGVLEVSAPDGALLLVDGIERGSAPFTGPVRVAAGEHEVVLRGGDELLLEQSVTVAGGMTSGIEVEEPDAEQSAPQPATAPQPAAAPEPEPAEDEGGRVWTWIALGTGAALVAGGAVAGGVSIGKEKDLESKCDGGVCDSSLASERDTVKSLNSTADILYGVGAAALVSGAVLFFVEPDGEEERPLAVAPRVGPDGAGLAVQGRF